MLSKIIERELRMMLDEERYCHTLGVLKVATDLALTSRVDPEKIKYASLLHDCARSLSNEKLKNYIKEFNIPLNGIEIVSPGLWHGPVGAELAFRKFGIEEKEILRAIALHTTGDRNMSLLEKIIYVADYVEPNRRLPNVEKIKELAFQDLDRATLMVIGEKLRYLLEEKVPIHPRSIEAWNDLTQKIYNQRASILGT